MRAALDGLIHGRRTRTQTLFDEIAGCQDATKASNALAAAIEADRNAPGEVILPAAGWILPP